MRMDMRLFASSLSCFYGNALVMAAYQLWRHISYGGILVMAPVGQLLFVLQRLALDRHDLLASIGQLLAFGP